jgi:uncharacterized LabA/DUF88 family protein
MAAYLVVDVDDLLERFQARGMIVDLQELAVGLRGGAALAAGLVSVDKLRAIAVANWSAYEHKRGALNPMSIFRAAGYEVFEVLNRETIADILIIHYFSYDPDPVDELILATTSRDLLPLIRRIKTTRSARIRMWGSEDVLKGTEFADEIIFQPLETLLGIQSKNVAVYIDFENIAISLNEQGYMVNLDHLIERMLSQARSHGQVVKLSAYAPWGQRGTLPPLVDYAGREVADDAPSRLALANIDPVFNLPGKNSADIRIARDIITDSGYSESADVYILASGDRDFNDVINTLVQRGKTVIVWGVKGSIARQIMQHQAVQLEFFDEFTDLATHQSLSQSPMLAHDDGDFVPSQWSSVVIQFDRLAQRLNTDTLETDQLISQLQDVGAVASQDRGYDLVSQALSMGLLQSVNNNGSMTANTQHPIVDKTRTIANSIMRRVANTLSVRGWEYVNYGFLLKGLEMERDLSRVGMNADDQWRSHWIDTLVRERVLRRELVPHRHNPDDLVPVIRLPDDAPEPEAVVEQMQPQDGEPAEDWRGKSPQALAEYDATAFEMTVRVVVSVEQFTSFRNFAWCPLGSLHRRLRQFDPGMAFQRAVEYLQANGAVDVGEYSNPQSDFNTKGISINTDSPYARTILSQRDLFIRILLDLYERNALITAQHIRELAPSQNWDIDLWLSIMQTENVLNPLQGRDDQYSLFRTHHTVKLVADDR